MGETSEGVLDYRTVAPDHVVYNHCPRCAGSLRDHTDATNSRIRPVCEKCGWTYYPTNPIGVLVVVEVGSGIVLVHPPSGTPEAPASLPGGLVEYAETPEAAAVRLVREQTGLEIEVAEELDPVPATWNAVRACARFRFRRACGRRRAATGRRRRTGSRLPARRHGCAHPDPRRQPARPRPLRRQAPVDRGRPLGHRADRELCAGAR